MKKRRDLSEHDRTLFEQAGDYLEQVRLSYFRWLKRDGETPDSAFPDPGLGEEKRKYAEFLESEQKLN